MICSHVFKSKPKGKSKGKLAKLNVKENNDMSGLSNEIGAARSQKKKGEVLISAKPKSGYELIKDHSVVDFSIQVCCHHRKEKSQAAPLHMNSKARGVSPHGDMRKPT